MWTPDQRQTGESKRRVKNLLWIPCPWARPSPCSKCSVSCSSCSFSLSSLAAASSSDPLTCNWASDPAWRSRKVRKGPPRANSSSSGRLPQFRCRRAGLTTWRAHKNRAALRRSWDRIAKLQPPKSTRAGSFGQRISRHCAEFRNLRELTVPSPAHAPVLKDLSKASVGTSWQAFKRRIIRGGQKGAEQEVIRVGPGDSRAHLEAGWETSSWMYPGGVVGRKRDAEGCHSVFWCRGLISQALNEDLEYRSGGQCSSLEELRRTQPRKSSPVPAWLFVSRSDL